MEDAEQILVCSVCGQSCRANTAFCGSCRSRLPAGQTTTGSVASAPDSSAYIPWRRYATWAAAAVVSVLVLWAVYVNVGPYRFLPPPATNISSISGPGEWAMSQGSPDRNAVLEGETFTPSGVVQWKFQSRLGLFASPAIASGRVYIGTGDGRLVALDAESGDIRWEFTAGDAVKTSPAVAGGYVFAGLQDNRVIALNTETGDLVWEFLTGNPILSSPVVYEGVLYIGSNDWRLYALDVATGEERWSFRADDVIRSDPAVHPPVVAFTDIRGKLYLLDLKTGKRRFDYQGASGAEGGAAFYGDRLFFADQGGRVRSIDWSQREFPFEKTLVWIRLQLAHFGVIESVGQQKGFDWFFLERDSGFTTTPSIAHDLVYATSRSGSILALGRESGDLKWRFESPHPFEVSPSVWGETLLAADAGGTLYAVDALTGRQIWTYDTGSPLASTPFMVSGGALYLTTVEGTLLSLR